MARHAPVVEHAGNTMTVIAPTAEEAFAVIGDAGPGFRTTSIGKVRRGGLAGFFATEMVRVVAEGPAAGGTTRGVTALDGSAPGAATPAAAGSALGLATADDLLASLCGTEGPFAGRLAAGIQRSLHAPPSAIAPTAPGRADVPTIVAAPATSGVHDVGRAEPALGALIDERPPRQTPDGAEATPAGVVAGRPAGVWTAAALEAVGLPARLVGRVAGVRPYDEVTWNAALMLAVRDWCGTDLPTGAVLAGPAARPLATALRMTVVAADDVADHEGPCAVLDVGAGPLGRGLGERPLHLVVGGDWRHLATIQPATVSAATPADLVDAVRVAAAWDAPLGWMHDGTSAARIDPFLVAGHLRALLAAEAPGGATAASNGTRNARPRSARRDGAGTSSTGGAA